MCRQVSKQSLIKLGVGGERERGGRERVSTIARISLHTAIIYSFWNLKKLQISTPYARKQTPKTFKTSIRILNWHPDKAGISICGKMAPEHSFLSSCINLIFNIYISMAEAYVCATTLLGNPQNTMHYRSMLKGGCLKAFINYSGVQIIPCRIAHK